MDSARRCLAPAGSSEWPWPPQPHAVSDTSRLSEGFWLLFPFAASFLESLLAGDLRSRLHIVPSAGRGRPNQPEGKPGCAPALPGDLGQRHRTGGMALGWRRAELDGYWKGTLPCEGGQALAQSAQRSCGCPWIPGSAQGQVGQGMEQPGIGDGVPAHGWALRSLSKGPVCDPTRGHRRQQVTASSTSGCQRRFSVATQSPLVNTLFWDLSLAGCNCQLSPLGAVYPLSPGWFESGKAIATPSQPEPCSALQPSGPAGGILDGYLYSRTRKNGIGCALEAVPGELAHTAARMGQGWTRTLTGGDTVNFTVLSLALTPMFS
ncbi:uncharacterized protein LOC132333743 isoform X1 [Haemorhous mexicanus]|uniref:uncharacterized protein LOC132333743 isoform X1 n=1 Tax=Haemorhous mexicanus TaxID=30427 RepID=UPI0028BDC06A|nr:uncharacterized protein LOC132333743 isoform X1 [Haemorhous mexicanus]XP_059715125.1 uncharacterized protein LOC132333743 isoform X1 [Haemorhous mexicanus]